MRNLSICRIRLKCDHCETLMSVRLQQIADEDIILCTCGKTSQLIDFGKAVKNLLEEEAMENEEVIY